MTKQKLPPCVRPWHRAVAMVLISAMVWAPVGARGPGRPGIDADRKSTRLNSSHG